MAASAFGFGYPVPASKSSLRAPSSDASQTVMTLRDYRPQLSMRTISTAMTVSEDILMAEREGSGSDTDGALKIRTAGRQARDEGLPVTACNHPADTPANYQWVSSWMQPSATAPEDAS
jgi:hypothetical protein